MNLNKNYPYGLISLPAHDPSESFESVKFEGMSSHVGGIRLYHLKMAEVMVDFKKAGLWKSKKTIPDDVREALRQGYYHGLGSI